MKVLKCLKMDSILKIKHFDIWMILKLFPDIDNLHFPIKAVYCEFHAVDQKMITSKRSLSTDLSAKVHPFLKHPEKWL